MRFAIILDNKAHHIFEQDIKPVFGPDPEGNPIIAIDITDRPEVQVGWLYDVETDDFTKPLLLGLKI